MEYSVGCIDFEKEDEEDFCSCIAEFEQVGDPEESSNEDADEFEFKLYFKGISSMGHKTSGIGVVFERLNENPFQLQKKLHFHVENCVAEYLALMAALLEASRHNACHVRAFTDSDVVYNQIVLGEKLENQLLDALRERILELTGEFPSFVLKLTSEDELFTPLKLAQEATGYSFEKHSPQRRSFIRSDCSENLSLEERHSNNFTVNSGDNDAKWRRCLYCRETIELTNGSYRTICRCGREFCYACGLEYNETQQICPCFWNTENSSNHPPIGFTHDADPWRSSSSSHSEVASFRLQPFQGFPSEEHVTNDSHSSGSSSNPCSHSYFDAIKDLNQIPWLERFVYVISDDYTEGYIQ